MQMEAGKEYRTRDGRKASGIMASGSQAYPFIGSVNGLTGFTWLANGNCHATAAGNSLDLIALWEEPTVAMPDKLPADETIRLADVHRHFKHFTAQDGPGDCGAELPAPLSNVVGFRDYLSGIQGYGPLEDVLAEAAQQAAYGKGKERHANGKPFTQQPILEITRSVGIGFPTGQICKKTQEAIGMVARGKHDSAVAELLGAIVYAAAAIIQIREIGSKELTS